MLRIQNMKPSYKKQNFYFFTIEYFKKFYFFGFSHVSSTRTNSIQDIVGFSPLCAVLVPSIRPHPNWSSIVLIMLRILLQTCQLRLFFFFFLLISRKDSSKTKGELSKSLRYKNKEKNCINKLQSQLGT